MNPLPMEEEGPKGGGWPTPKPSSLKRVAEGRVMLRFSSAEGRLFGLHRPPGGDAEGRGGAFPERSEAAFSAEGWLFGF